MTDLRTVETIEIDGEYRVRVAETRDGELYEGVVVATKGHPFSQALAKAFGGDRDGWSSVDDAPTVSAGVDHKFTVAGLAIDHYHFQLLEEDEGSEWDGPEGDLGVPDLATDDPNHPATHGFRHHNSQEESGCSCATPEGGDPEMAKTGAEEGTDA